MANDEEDEVIAQHPQIRHTELVQHTLGEVALGERLEQDEEAQRRLASVEAGYAEAAKKLDVATDSARILERLEAEEAKPSWIRRWWPAVGLVAALAAVPLVMMQGPEVPTTRTKGLAPALELYVDDPTGPRLARDGVRLVEGDAIQFKYRADGHPYLFVVSVDEAGRISPLYPDVPTESITVDPAGTNVLEGSIILDDVVGAERIFAVFSKVPLAFGELERAVETNRRDGTDVTALQALGIERDDVFETSILIIKE